MSLSSNGISTISGRQTDAAGKVDIAVEYAFNALTSEARRLLLPIRPVDGFAYLGDGAVRWQFEEACRAVLSSLSR